MTYPNAKIIRAITRERKKSDKKKICDAIGMAAKMGQEKISVVVEEPRKHIKPLTDEGFKVHMDGRFLIIKWEEKK